MFECLLESGDLFRKVIAAIQDLVTDGNFQCNEEAITLQGMDSSHVSLIALSLRREGFSQFRCDKEVTLGINFQALSKVLKCMGAKDKLNLRADDDGDSCMFIFKNEKEDRVSNFELKLMDIDAEQLGIPDTDYSSVVRMPSTEFQRIITNLGQIGETVSISASKDGVKFSVVGDIGSGDMMLRQTDVEDIDAIDMDDSDDEGEEDESSEAESDGMNEGETGTVPADDGDEKGADIAIKTETKGEGKESMDVDGNEKKLKKKKKKSKKKKGKKSKTARRTRSRAGEDNRVMVEVEEPVSQNFAIRYLQNFTKATNLSKLVTLSMGAEVPLVVEYRMDDLGSIRYYLAPKIEDSED